MGAVCMYEPDTCEVQRRQVVGNQHGWEEPNSGLLQEYDVFLTLSISLAPHVIGSSVMLRSNKFGGVETAQWVKYLLCKNEDLISDPHHKHQKPDMMAHACNSRASREETGMSLGLLGQLV